MKPNRPITTADVARTLNIGTRRVQQLADAGVLSFVRTPGGIRIFDPEQVEHVRESRERKLQTERVISGLIATASLAHGPIAATIDQGYRRFASDVEEPAEARRSRRKARKQKSEDSE